MIFLSALKLLVSYSILLFHLLETVPSIYVCPSANPKYKTMDVLLIHRPPNFYSATNQFGIEFFSFLRRTLHKKKNNDEKNINNKIKNKKIK